MLNIIKSKLNKAYKKKPTNSTNVTIYNRDLVPSVRN